MGRIWYESNLDEYGEKGGEHRTPKGWLSLSSFVIGCHHLSRRNFQSHEGLTSQVEVWTKVAKTAGLFSCSPHQFFRVTYILLSVSKTYGIIPREVKMAKKVLIVYHTLSGNTKAAAKA